MSITILLIIITVAISMYAWRNQNLMENWVHHPQSVAQHNEWWRLLTSGFLHADFGHLFFNMFSFYMFGRVVEQYFMAIFGPTMGIVLYLVLYLGAIILSDLPTYFKHRNDRGYYSLGASGGVAAIIFSSIYFNPQSELIIFPIPFHIKGYIFGALYLIYSYYQARRAGDGINHSAHFYGALFGVVFTIGLVPEYFPRFLELILE
ncbi:rhomboid family intramembrane serine protease [Nibribacter ruber]|uniref:Rhomboid family intramembrane serine protease n=1 Tax=Nibribacter ruber TaxID=2698458 RepID=A0A6P1P518_9BACT|nr:rhomboid family intramembrane serine protease [Nibribacter ruber]